MAYLTRKITKNRDQRYGYWTYGADVEWEHNIRVTPFTEMIERDQAIEDRRACPVPFLPLIRHKPGGGAAPPMPQRTSWVYVIRSDSGPVKIGIATDPQDRLRTMQTGSPSRLTLLGVTRGGRNKERELHQRFAAHRLHGEWFAPAPEILEMVATYQPLPSPPQKD